MTSDWAFMNVQYLRFRIVGYMLSVWSYVCVFIMQPHIQCLRAKVFIL